MKLKTRSLYMIKNIFGYNAVKSLTMLISMVCVFILALLEHRKEFFCIKLLPLSFLIVLCLFNYRKSVKGLGSFIVYWAYFFRFTVFPVLIVLGDYRADVSVDIYGPYFNKACIVMIIELVVVFCALSYFANKSLKKIKKQKKLNANCDMTVSNTKLINRIDNLCSSSIIRLILAICLAYVLFVCLLYPGLIKLYWRVLFISDRSGNNNMLLSQYISTIPGYIYYVFKFCAELTRYLIAAVFVAQVNKNKDNALMSWTLTIIITVCSVAILTSEQINSVIIGVAIAYYMLLKYKESDRIIVVFGLFILIVMAVLFFIKIADVSDLGSLGRIMNNYFNGPISTAIALYTKNNVANFGTTPIRDIVGSIPFVGRIVDYNTLNEVYRASNNIHTAIMPMAGYGYCYFGYLGCWLPALLVVWTVDFFDELTMKRVGDGLRILLYVCIIHLALSVFMYNVCIYYNTWIYIYAPILLMTLFAKQFRGNYKIRTKNGLKLANSASII